MHPAEHCGWGRVGYISSIHHHNRSPQNPTYIPRVNHYIGIVVFSCSTLEHLKKQIVFSTVSAIHLKKQYHIYPGYIHQIKNT